MIAVYLLYAFSELLSLALGRSSGKGTPPSRIFRLGYHVAEAMQGEAQWNAANACAGKVSLFGGLLAFVFFPAHAWPLKLSTGRMALLYCCICLLWALSVLRIPLYCLRKNFRATQRNKQGRAGCPARPIFSWTNPQNVL